MAESLGVDLFRVVAADRFEDAPEGHRPRDVMPDVKSILVLGIKYLDAQLEILPSREEGFFTQGPRQQMFAGHNDLISRRLDEIVTLWREVWRRRVSRLIIRWPRQEGSINAT